MYGLDEERENDIAYLAGFFAAKMILQPEYNRIVLRHSNQKLLKHLAETVERVTYKKTTVTHASTTTNKNRYAITISGKRLEFLFRLLRPYLRNTPWETRINEWVGPDPLANLDDKIRFPWDP